MIRRGKGRFSSLFPSDRFLHALVHVSRVRGAGWPAQSLALREMQFWVILAKHLRHRLSWLTP